MSKTEKTPKKRSFRVNRGGCWAYGTRNAQIAYRRVDDPAGGAVLGFRLLEVLDEQD